MNSTRESDDQYISPRHSPIQQVEVSHGSISNQPTMYEITDSQQYNTSTAFFCDVILLIILFAVCVFVMLFWYDHVPGLDTYFVNGQHHGEKKVIVILCIVLILAMFILLVIRWMKRSKCNICHRKLFSRNLKDSYDSGIIDDLFETSHTFTSTHSQCINIKLGELNENELDDIRRVLLCFLNFHSADDWMQTSINANTLSSFNTLTPNQQNRHLFPKIKFTIKVVLAGAPGVGKTSIFHRILYNSFTDYYMSTLGADVGLTTFHIYPNEYNNHIAINLQLWDISGSENFSDLARIVYKDATAFLVICDASSQESYLLALPWVRDIETFVYDPYIGVLRNKIDAAEHLDSESMSNFSKHDSFELSAKTGEKVLETMVSVVTKSVLHEIGKLL